MRMLLMVIGTGLCASWALGQEDTVKIRELICERPPVRAGQPMPVLAIVANEGAEAAEVEVRLTVPEGLALADGANATTVTVPAPGETDLRWTVTAAGGTRADLIMELVVKGEITKSRVLPMRFLPAIDDPVDGYIPPPVPAESPLLVGVHHCPLWEADTYARWEQIRKYPERTPVLGFYDAVDPEVADWETKWAVEHGIDFFIYCWYRVSEGGPVETMLEGAITEGFLKSRYADQMKFTIMWENQRRGVSGVAGHADLKENLLPYWMETFFTHPSYLVIDNKPVLFIYRPEFLVDDLGGIAQVREAFGVMAEACREEGFDGITLMGEYRGLDPNHLTLMRDLGLDYTFA